MRREQPKDSMNQPMMSKRKRNAISNGLFLASLGVLFYTNFWWPGILLSIWVALAARQFLSGRTFDLIITTIILVGIFLVSFLRITWDILMPVLFVLGGLYIIFREYFSEEEKEDETKE